MPSVFWIGWGFAALIALGGALVGARSSSASFGSGALMGLFMGFMLAFPLIALGLASS